MARLTQNLTLGAVWENFIRGKYAQSLMLRPAFGVGLGLSLGRISLAADGRLDLRDGASRTPDVLLGAEVLPTGGLACRLGYYTDQAVVGAARRQAATAGIGLMSAAASFHVSLERTFGAATSWGVFTGLQLAV